MTEPQSVALIREALEAYRSDLAGEQQLAANATAQERIMHAVARHQFFSGACTPDAIAEVLQHVAALEARVRELEAALTTFVDEYAAMINSGDCGFWNPEEEPKVIAARAALSAAARGE